MSALKLYNSMTREKQTFTPMREGKVGMYVCGMTVYDFCHLGHARVMVGFDVAYRWLKALGYEVTYVRNITDVDDKILARAAEQNLEVSELTQTFIDAMHEDADQLGCLRPTLEPKATDHISHMQQLISKLIEKGHAYVSGSDVYFSVESFKDYGKLSMRRLSDMQAGASERGVDASLKKHPFDFALWKGAEQGLSWDSAWGSGRPGWHIECSAMSQHCLGESFDIHGGGFDLQFPHHENEIAQSEAASGKTYAHTWMHVGFVNVDGEKMSKSLGNFFTIKDLLAQHDPETLRYLLLSSHYRSPIQFSDALLKDAHAALSRFYTALRPYEGLEAASLTSAEFTQVMNDDLNTPQALALMHELVKQINSLAATDSEQAKIKAAELLGMGQLLGLLARSPSEFFQSDQAGDLISAVQIEQLIQQRAEAKSNRDFARADEIRKTLVERGVVLEDSQNGTTWRRENPSR